MKNKRSKEYRKIGNSTQRGHYFEQQALEHLQRNHLVLIERNFRSKLGEIDLIMRDKNTLVFVEVRFRKYQTYGGGAASVTLDKQQKLIRTALLFLQKQKLKNSCRFDVVDVSYSCTDSTNDPLTIHWIKNAFQVLT